MKPEVAALHNARHYLRLALAGIDEALAGDRDPKPENLLGQSPRDDGNELARLQALAASRNSDLSYDTKQAVVEALARGDYDGARQLLGESTAV